MNSLYRSANIAMFCKRLIPNQKVLTGVRYLYSNEFLGIDKYIEVRDMTRRRLGNVAENFSHRLQQQISSSPTSMVFTEDIKTFIHISEDTPEDIDLCIEMIKRFHKQNNEMRFGTFVFGPVVMRLLYHLKKPDIALQLLKDKELDGFFCQIKSYILSMQLFYDHSMYQEIIDLNTDMRSKPFISNKFPREVLVFVMAACYKLNTGESYQYALDAFSMAREAGVPVNRKALHFLVALALNQGQSDIALEVVSNVEKNNGITGNNLKLQAYAQLDRMQDAFSLLQNVGDQDVPIQSRVRGEICQSTLDALKKSVDRINDTEVSHTFEQICRSLKESNSLTVQTIDELVCTPVVMRPFVRETMFNDGPRNTFQNRFGNKDQFFGNRNDSYRNRDEPFVGRNEPLPRRSFAGMSDDY